MPSSIPESTPRISVVMPLYNAALFVAEALESIGRQTMPVHEVMVVDDGSTDGSAEIVTAYPFATLVRKEHSGICETLNRGLASVTGNYLAFLDADDRWLPEKTAIQMATLKADPQLDMVFGHTRRFGSMIEGENRTETIIDVIPGVAKACMLIRRSAFERVGSFSSKRDGHDFLSWYLRAREINLRGKILPETLMERRIHAANYGILHKSDQRKAYFATLKTSLDRRRAARLSVSLEPRP